MSQLPFEYTVKPSKRAKHVRVSVSARDGVILTVPARMPRSAAEKFLAQKSDWVTRALSRIEPKRAEFKEARTLSPEVISARQQQLKQEAKVALPARCRELARASGMPAPTKITVRRMRSRWGSCSGRGTISLSQNLIFLPQPLIDHVIYHELAHLKHLDHSPNFHTLLAKLDPNKENHAMKLKEAEKYIPAWADIDV